MSATNAQPIRVCAENGIYGKGLQWTGQGPTKQFIYRANPDRFITTKLLTCSGYKLYQSETHSIKLLRIR